MVVGGWMVKEGYWYGLPLILLSGGFFGFRLPWFGVASFFLAVLVLNFFRDPERTIPIDPQAVVSPADGRIVQVEMEPFEGRPAQRLSIFMSPLDVHVNRSPIAGTIRDVSYRKGVFHIASHPEASLENEQNVFIIEGDQGPVVVRLIAGILARRIIFWKRTGDSLARGERIGMIKFGSRVDVLLPLEVELRVKVGDHVLAGSSIIGITRAKPEPAG